MLHARLLAPLALALVVVCVGCSSADDTAASPEPLTTSELGWIRAESAWAIAIYDDDLGAPAGAALVRECEKRLDEVGDAPTDRLRPAAEHALSTCPFLGDRGSFRQAWDVLGQVDDLVDPYLRESQAVPLVEDPTAASRGDLELSAQATEAADSDPLEVRCWSRDDFRRVVAERNAWNDYADTPEDLYGWWDDFDSRIHMRLDQCNTVRRFATDDVLGWTRKEQVEGANSLDTFAHEIQHVVLPDADEAEAECAASRAMRKVALRLGATENESDRLVALYHSDVYPTLGDDYQKDCGD